MQKEEKGGGTFTYFFFFFDERHMMWSSLYSQLKGIGRIESKKIFYRNRIEDKRKKEKKRVQWKSVSFNYSNNKFLGKINLIVINLRNFEKCFVFLEIHLETFLVNDFRFLSEEKSLFLILEWETLSPFWEIFEGLVIFEDLVIFWDLEISLGYVIFYLLVIFWDLEIFLGYVIFYQLVICEDLEIFWDFVICEDLEIFCEENVNKSDFSFLQENEILNKNVFLDSFFFSFCMREIWIENEREIEILNENRIFFFFSWEVIFFYFHYSSLWKGISLPTE